jgi:hypothetical protein
MDHRRIPTCIILVLLIVSSVTVMAQESVYGPAAPPDAGFVRVINARSDGSEVRLDVGSQRFNGVEPGEASPYRPVVSGVYLPQTLGLETDLFVRPEGYTSLAVTDDEIVVIPDTVHGDPARAQLVLYNFTGGGAASLVLADSGQPVIPGVAPGESSSLAVNAISASFAVVGDSSGSSGSDGWSRLVDSIQLRRGRSYSFIAYRNGSDVTVALVTASVELE